MAVQPTHRGGVGSRLWGRAVCVWGMQGGGYSGGVRLPGGSQCCWSAQNFVSDTQLMHVCIVRAFVCYGEDGLPTGLLQARRAGGAIRPRMRARVWRAPGQGGVGVAETARMMTYRRAVSRVAAQPATAAADALHCTHFDRDSVEQR